MSTIRLALLLGVLVLVNISVFSALIATPKLAVTFLDVGQGDAILIQSPSGTTMLIDGGAGRAVLRELGSVLPFGERSIDVVMASHPDADHIGGLADVFNAYEVRTFIDPGIPNDTSAAKALSAALDAEPGLISHVARRGMRLALGGGVYADVLYPDRDVSKAETNNGSIVLHLSYGKTSFLFSGDLDSKIEDWLVLLDEGSLDSDVLKAGHHGSKYSTSNEWLSAVTPSAVAISVGEKNSYGHPTADTLTRIESADAKTYRTDRDGRLRFVSDGSSVRKD